MRKISYRPYFLLILFFLCVLSLPHQVAERMRSTAVCSFAPCWRSLSFIKHKALFLLTLPFSTSSVKQLDIDQLSQENLLLRSSVESMREWLLYEDRIEEQLERYKALIETHADKEFFKRRSKELCHLLDLQISALPGKVIFREPASWSSSLWINLGEKDNVRLKKKIVGKNSPVLLGTSIVGVIEYVGSSRSRVRLITDSRLTPSVRAVRGGEQNRYLIEHLESLLFSLEARPDLFTLPEERTACFHALSLLKKQLLEQSGDLYLAKGELRGAGHPLWRSRNQVLKGIGFNCDFSDAEGPARDLRSGEPYQASHREGPVQLLLPGDLLVTTGLDGVFPAGLRVASVSSVHTLKEGASSYEIEAMATAGDLDGLRSVFVLPPLAAE